MELRDLNDDFRNFVNQHIKDEWGGPKIVSRGNLYDSSNLPGFAMIDGDTVMGAILYQIQQEECEISVLFSLFELKGIGTQLINAVIDTAKKAQCKRIWLVTTNDNTHAIRYYQKRGFSLKAVHINAFDITRELKNNIPLFGTDDIPIQHEFEFEILL